MNRQGMIWAGAAVVGLAVTVRLAVSWGGEIFRFRTGGTPTQPELIVNLITDAVKNHPPPRHAVNIDGMASYLQLVLLTTAAGFTIYCGYKSIRLGQRTDETNLESSTDCDPPHHGR